jgi:hypothetical protein
MAHCTRPPRRFVASGWARARLDIQTDIRPSLRCRARNRTAQAEISRRRHGACRRPAATAARTAVTPDATAVLFLRVRNRIRIRSQTRWVSRVRESGGERRARAPPAATTPRASRRHRCRRHGARLQSSHIGCCGNGGNCGGCRVRRVRRRRRRLRQSPPRRHRHGARLHRVSHHGHAGCGWGRRQMRAAEDGSGAGRERRRRQTGRGGGGRRRWRTGRIADGVDS